MNQPNKVKTRRTFADIADGLGYDLATNPDGSYVSFDTAAAYSVYKAALDSVILPESSQGLKRFEVGDKCQAFHAGKEIWIDATIIAMETTNVSDDWDVPEDVRSVPQTVELSDDEKIEGLNNLGARGPSLKDFARALANGKTLDQLCAEYGVATMREI